MTLSRHNRQPDAPKRRKVSIVGFEQQLKPTAPLDDPAYEIWGLNMANRLGFMVDSHGDFRADRWFDLHQRHAQSERDLAWIDACPIPIYLPEVFTQNPLARRYPIEAVIDYFDMDYFCSSFAYMLALAAFENFHEIRLDGISLNWRRERLVKRANMEYWIGFLRGRGEYEIVIPDESLLLKHPYRYGLDYTEEKEAVELMMAVNAMQVLNNPAVYKIYQNATNELGREAAIDDAQVALAKQQGHL